MGILAKSAYLILLLQLAFTGPSLLAAVNKSAPAKADLKSVEKQLKQHSALMTQLRDKVQQYEKSLTSNNQRYLQMIEQRKVIESKIDFLSAQLAENELVLTKKMERANSALNGVVLSAIDEQNDASNLLSRKMLGSALKRRLVELKLALAENENHKRDLEQLNNAYLTLQENERQVSAILSQLEADKKVVVQNYETVSKKEDEFRSTFQKLKANMYRESAKKVEERQERVAKTFFAPIGEFSNLNYKKKKGVSFYFKTIQPVTAPSEGKIVFKGTVGSFGQVLFIDHGNDLRSVILGHFSPKVDKDMMVKKGDVLGYTDQMGNKIGEIYYEVREKNIALNTITLLDKSSIAVR